MKKKGAALLSVVVVMSVAFLLSAIILDRSLKSGRRINETLTDRRAYYYTESLIYDMAAYINGANNKVAKGTFASSESNTNNIRLLIDPNVATYKVTLTSDVVKNYESSEEVEYTYNIEASANYSGRNYVVKMQLSSRYLKGTALVFTSHKINSRRAYKV